MNFRDNKLKIIAVLVIFILIVTNITMFVLNKRRLAKCIKNKTTDYIEL